MALRIEEYALIGDCQTAALVGRNGSIDWLCVPRFDSGACFAALLGTPDHGRWQIAPVAPSRATRRAYRDGTLILETDYETDEGAVTLVDCMPPRSNEPDLLRLVVGRRGTVRMRMQLIIRFDYGSIVPWVRKIDGALHAIAGPDSLRLETPIETHGEDLTTVADFTVSAGERIPFVLLWYPSHEPPPPAVDCEAALRFTEEWWREWSSRLVHDGPWRDAVQRSLITLKALTYAPTGGIVAAPTTSLPERIGGVRNWDYRFCWLRDATFALYALMSSGYVEEARAWREWLLRAAAGNPEQLHIMYGVAGERRLIELELPWLPGYDGSAPVRIGNAASTQFQLDVFGEVLDSMYQARKVGLASANDTWKFEEALIGYLESGAWKEPDEGIWEVRGPRRHFTHSKMMAWVAVDRGVRAIERCKCEGPVERWRALRDEIHDEVCRAGFNAELDSFVQYYGAERELDASLLMMPLVGFLPATDRRVRGTVAAIERHLMRDGFVQRYSVKPEIDGLPPGEGAFIACTFWLADNYTMIGRRDEALAVFERLLALCNDVGLLSEEYDPVARRMLGNFPQAYSHVGLVNTARNLALRDHGPAQDRPA
jgi:GH15 family glucan-1,4-alpha-glucosidase